MGRSNRQYLADGRMPEWETPLRKAAGLLDDVIGDIHEAIGLDGQYDNAADDGALAEKLSLAQRLIKEELPDDGKCRTCGRVRCGP